MTVIIIELKSVNVVLFSRYFSATSWLCTKWHIYIHIFIPTTEMGNALLDVITGAYNPSGRLVVTWYTNDDQLPPMISYSMVNRTYRYMEGKPMFYFGYGMSYTTFNYSNFMVSYGK